jgi:cobalt-zinc-cadmium resistance protein CzcA
MNEYIKLAETLEYYEQHALTEAELIIEQTILSYRSGEMDYNDYIINVNRGLEIRYRFLDALDSYNETIIRLDYLTGKTL